MSVAISIEHISKAYRLGLIGGDTLKEDVARWWAKLRGRPDPLLKVGQEHHARREGELFWALDDVSVQVKEGEVLGVIGRNGAGKSTLLKILSQVTAPTSGEVKIRGRVGSLLEVGTGFHPDLTGRENIFLNGAILGMTQADVRRRLDEIIEFSGIEEFIDTPVKRYSSGMYVRLAFAVAAHLEPDILILDEVLAVGDANFQRRCLGKMEDVAKHGRTVLFVTHNLAAVSRFCSTCVWLDAGRIRACGNTDAIVPDYLLDGLGGSGELAYATDQERPQSEFVALSAIRLKNRAGRVVSVHSAGEPLFVEVEYEVLQRATGLRVGIEFVSAEGYKLFGTKDLDVLPDDYVRVPGRYLSRCELPADFLNQGLYYVTVGSDFPMLQGHFRVERAVSFTVEALGTVGGHHADGRAGFIRMRFPWTVEQIGTHAASEARVAESRGPGR